MVRNKSDSPVSASCSLDRSLAAKQVQRSSRTLVRVKVLTLCTNGYESSSLLRSCGSSREHNERRVLCFVCQIRRPKGVIWFHSHKNDSLKSLRQLASVQSMGVESGSIHRRYQEEKRDWEQQRRG